MAEIGSLIFLDDISINHVKMKALSEAAIVPNVKESFSCTDDGKFYCRAEEGAALASVVMWEIQLLKMQISGIDGFS